jgi:hypothetical protein
LRWAGRELRKAPEESLVHQMLVAVAEHDLQLGIKRESILMDAPTYDSVEELLANANDLHVWAAAVRDQDPELRNDSKAANKVAATVPTLNAHVAELKATADVLDGKLA